MGQSGQRVFLGKVFFRGKIILKTGMHIGGSQESMQIGGVDSPIIRDSGNNLPYIPGSSLKGKLRSTLEKFGKRIKEGKKEKLSSNRSIGTFRQKVFIHCCEDIQLALNCEVCRIFGATGDDREFQKGKKDRRGDKAGNLPALLMVRDSLLDDAFMHPSRLLTDVKTETGVDRSTMAANPRQVERLLPDTAFIFEMVYSVENITLAGKAKTDFSEANLKIDLDNILTCMEIIESEGIGGHTSRGYGKVNFVFTEFLGRSLDYFKGKTEKEKGKSDGGFSIQEAREKIDEIVKFLKEESGNAVSG